MAGPVIVVDYDPAWAATFEELRRMLADALGDIAERIEHVGSTSVPGLAAKPIVDIDIVIANRARLPIAVERLRRIGYEHRGDLGVTGREAFASRMGGPMAETRRDWPSHNLYVCAQDARELRRHVAFRDWLRSHPDDRRRYADLKRRLAAKYEHDRDAYCDGKRGLVESVLTQALGVGFCTARAVSRPFSVDDAPYAHPVFSDAEVMRYAVGEPDESLHATMQRLQRYDDLQIEHGFSKWAVWDREFGTYLGDAGLTVVPETAEVELGYRLGQAHWGKGLATEIAAAWLRHVVDELKLDRIIAFADPRNTASLRVLQKLGMTFDRKDRLLGMDCVVYEAHLEPGVKPMAGKPKRKTRRKTVKATTRRTSAKKTARRKAGTRKASKKVARTSTKKATRRKAGTRKASKKAARTRTEKTMRKKTATRKASKEAARTSTKKATRKKAAQKVSASTGAAERIERRIAELGDWRGEQLAEIRKLIHEVDPEVVEEWKWMGTPVWSHEGMYALANPHKDKVKLTFFHGAQLSDPQKLFNAGLGGNKWRAIDFRRGDAIDKTALKALLREAIAYNAKHAVPKSKGSRS